MNKRPLLFAGSSHVKLAQSVARALHISLGQMFLSQFPDGETHVQILEEVRGRDVFILQSMAGSPNHYLFELLIIADAVKRGSARSITAVIPYLGYCRQDRKDKPGVPITAKLVADVLSAAGITHLITCDLHADQVEGFFTITVDHLHCRNLLCETLKTMVKEPYIVVAPDIGSIKIGEKIAKLLNTELVVIKKERLSDCEVRGVLIGDVRGLNVFMIDDLCSTGATLVAAASLCKQEGCKKVLAAVTHGLFAQDAIQRIESSKLDSLLITDTVAAEYAPSLSIQSISVAPLLAAAISRSLP